jgi:hypothetical protein
MDPVGDYWFSRIEAHMARSNEILERSNAIAERHAAAYERLETQQDDLRDFMRELTLRVERTGREHTAAIRRMGDEIVTELRAQRGALLAILDRLAPGDSGSAA